MSFLNTLFLDNSRNDFAYDDDDDFLNLSDEDGNNERGSGQTPEQESIDRDHSVIQVRQSEDVSQNEDATASSGNKSSEAHTFAKIKLSKEHHELLKLLPEKRVDIPQDFKVVSPSCFAVSRSKEHFSTASLEWVVIFYFVNFFLLIF